MTPMPGNLRDRKENWAHLACWAVLGIYGSHLERFPYWQQINTLILLGIAAQIYFHLRLRANALAVTEQQYPDIHASVERCRARFGNPDIQAYVIHPNELWFYKGGALSKGAFYLSTNTIENARAINDPRAMDYYVGREMGSALLGHGNIFRGHLSRVALIIAPIDIWHRRCMARSRDRAGLWACQSTEVAERCLAVMATGPKLGMETNLAVAKAQWISAASRWTTKLATLASFTPHATERIVNVQGHAKEFGIG